MRIFSTLFGSKKPEQEAARPKSDSPLSGEVYLHLSAMGWTMIGPNSGDTISGWMGLGVEESGWNRVVRMTREAIAANEQTLRSVKDIHLLLDDVGIGFTDDRTLGSSTDPEQIRKFGTQFLNARHVTYGRGAFRQELPGDGEDSHNDNNFLFYHAFSDVVPLRDLLSLFEAHGKKIRRAIPKPYLWVSQAADTPHQVHAVLDIGAEQCTLTMVHHEHGVLMVRTLNVGLLTLARDLDKGGSLGVDHAVAMLREKDLLRTLPPTLTPTPNESRGMGDYERIISAHMRNMGILKFVRETLDYFNIQRGLGMPDTLWITGMALFQEEKCSLVEPIKGLCAWLSKGLGLTCLLQPSSPLTILRETETQEHDCNLMPGTSMSQPLVIINKVPYFFSKNGMQSQPATPTQQQQKVRELDRSQGRMRGKGSGRSSRTSTRPGMMVKRNSSSTDPLGLLDKLHRLLHPDEQEKEIQNPNPFDPAPPPRDQRVLLVGVSAMVVLLCYWGLDALAKESSNASKLVTTFTNQRDELIKLRQTGEHEKGMLATGTKDKILWTAKILALSQAMDAHIWLSDIYLKQEKVESGQSVSTVNRLVIKGRVLPSTDGHIQKISDYSNRLMESEIFMRDFERVVFLGAELAKDEDVVHFTLEAWPKKQEIKVTQKNKEQDENNPVAIANKHNRNLENLQDNLKKQ